MAKRGTKAGDFYVEGHVATEQLENDLRQARQDVERETSAMGDAAEQNVGGGFKRAGESIEDSTSSVRKFSGAISSTWGIVTAFTGTIGGLVGLMVTLASKSEKIRDHFRDIASQDINIKQWEGLVEVAGKLVKVPDQLASDVQWQAARLEVEELQKEYEKLIQVVEEGQGPLAGFGQIGGAGAAERAAKAQTRITDIRERQAELSAIMSRRAEELAEREQRIATAIERQVTAAERAASIGMEGGISSFMPSLLPTDDEIADTINLYRDRALAVEDELADARTDNINRANQEWSDALSSRERLAAESAKRMADQMAREMSRALQQQATANGFAGPVEEMLRRIENQISAIKHGGL